MIHELPQDQRVPVTHLEKSAGWKSSSMYTQHHWCGGIGWGYAWKALAYMQRSHERGRLNEAQKDFMVALEETLIDRFHE